MRTGDSPDDDSSTHTRASGPSPTQKPSSAGTDNTRTPRAVTRCPASFPRSPAARSTGPPGAIREVSADVVGTGCDGVGVAEGEGEGVAVRSGPVGPPTAPTTIAA